MEQGLNLAQRIIKDLRNLSPSAWGISPNYLYVHIYCKIMKMHNILFTLQSIRFIGKQWKTNNDGRGAFLIFHSVIQEWIRYVITPVSTP